MVQYSLIQYHPSLLACNAFSYYLFFLNLCHSLTLSNIIFFPVHFRQNLFNSLSHPSFSLTSQPISLKSWTSDPSPYTAAHFYPHLFTTSFLISPPTFYIFKKIHHKTFFSAIKKKIISIWVLPLLLPMDPLPRFFLFSENIYPIGLKNCAHEYSRLINNTSDTYSVRKHEQYGYL